MPRPKATPAVQVHYALSDAQWSCPPCRSTGALHCASPDECGQMRLRQPLTGA